MVANRHARVIAICSLALAVACGDATGPSADARPYLELFFVDDLRTSLRHDGVMYVLAVPADTSFRLPDNQRVRFEIRSSSGDAEVGQLYRLYCPARERSQGYRCFDFAVAMQQGFTVADIADRVIAAGWRFNLVFGPGGSITVFDPRSLVAHARDVRSWPGVAITELTYSGCQSGAPHWCRSFSRLAAPIPIDTGSAKPADGILQVRAGDTLTLSYRQPDGSDLVRIAQVPN